MKVDDCGESEKGKYTEGQMLECSLKDEMGRTLSEARAEVQSMLGNIAVLQESKVTDFGQH